MPTVELHLLNTEQMMSFYRTRTAQDKKDWVKEMQEGGGYAAPVQIQVNLPASSTAEELAEEVFDLSNNPSRGAQRRTDIGRMRSVSVGDVVVVNGQHMLCDSRGWLALNELSPQSQPKPQSPR